MSDPKGLKLVLLAFLVTLCLSLVACGYQGRPQIGMEGLPPPRSPNMSSASNFSRPERTRPGSVPSEFGVFNRNDLEATTGGKTSAVQDDNREQPKEVVAEKPLVYSGIIKEFVLGEQVTLYLATESEKLKVSFAKRYATVNSYADAKGTLREQFSFSEVDPQSLIGKLAVVVQKDPFVIVNLYPEDTPKGPVFN